MIKIMKQIKNNPKIMRAWAVYDWANSVYSLVITSTIFPIYYSILTTAYEKNEFVEETGKWIKVPVRNMISFFGKQYEPDAVYGYSLTLSFFIVVILTPILSSLADIIGNKKSFLQFFCYLGATSCMGLALFVNMKTVYLGLLFSVTASIGFWGSLVFYNSFLPDIATKDKQDALSAKGYVYGYIGSVVLVIICLILIQVVAQNAKQALFYTRVSFLLTGAWWFGFSQYTFRHLPKFGEVKDQLPKDLVLLNFKNIFRKAFNILNGESFENIRNTFYGQTLFKIPEINARLFYSAKISNVFGGMGSWNDSPPYYAHEKGLEIEYDSLTEELLTQIRLALLYSVNEW